MPMQGPGWGSGWTRRLSESIDLGVMIAGSHGAVEFANGRAYDLLQSESDDELEQAFTRLKADVQRATGKSLFDLPDGQAAEVILEKEAERRNGLRLRVEVHHVEGDACSGRLILLHDMQVAQDLRQNLGAVLRYRRLTRALAIAAHDLKAPLNALVLNVNVIRRQLLGAAEFAAKPKCIDSLAAMEEEFHRFDRMLMAVLLESREVEARPQHFDLGRLVSRFSNLVRPLCIDQGVRLDLRLPRAEVPCSGDPDRVRQLLMNLAMNALDAMEGRGVLAISLVVEDGSARIRIADSGPGIAPDQLERIWDLHYSTKDGGNGIGLFVARAVVSELGGTIRVSNRPEGGCEFEVVLPLRGEH